MTRRSSHLRTTLRLIAELREVALDCDLGVEIDPVEIAEVVNTHPNPPRRWSTCIGATG
ncbi:MAG: hypothetical protein U0Q47_06710 [Mycobacterium sp.]